jgi:hypothetical protein
MVNFLSQKPQDKSHELSSYQAKGLLRFLMFIDVFVQKKSKINQN